MIYFGNVYIVICIMHYSSKYISAPWELIRTNFIVPNFTNFLDDSISLEIFRCVINIEAIWKLHVINNFTTTSLYCSHPDRSWWQFPAHKDIIGLMVYRFVGDDSPMVNRKGWERYHQLGTNIWLNLIQTSRRCWLSATSVSQMGFQ